MSALPVRLPYDDAATPHEMYGDCQAAGANLRLPVRAVPVGPRVGLDSYRRRPPTMYVVHDDVAATAGSLHLHLD